MSFAARLFVPTWSITAPGPAEFGVVTHTFENPVPAVATVYVRLSVNHCARAASSRTHAVVSRTVTETVDGHAPNDSVDRSSVDPVAPGIATPSLYHWIASGFPVGVTGVTNRVSVPV